jgi:hypothetical protein
MSRIWPQQAVYLQFMVWRGDRPDCRTKAQSEYPVLDGDLLAQLLELPEPMQAEVVAGMHLDPAWLQAAGTQQGVCVYVCGESECVCVSGRCVWDVIVCPCV